MDENTKRITAIIVNIAVMLVHRPVAQEVARKLVDQGTKVLLALTAVSAAHLRAVRMLVHLLVVQKDAVANAIAHTAITVLHRHPILDTSAGILVATCHPRRLRTMVAILGIPVFHHPRRLIMPVILMLAVANVELAHTVT
jgi:hypothetical protein